VIGTYSSVFIAGPSILELDMKKKEKETEPQKVTA
jgi:preprotein translocase subunit SecF